MMTVVAIVHIIFCLLLISIVLLQDPKSSGGGGGMFGGGSANSLLGATGGATFLTRITRYSAIVFGITCLTLTLLSRPETGSVIDTSPVRTTSPTAPFEKPAAPDSNHVIPKAPGQPSAAAGPTTGTPIDAAPEKSSPNSPAPNPPAAPSGGQKSGQ